MLSLTGTLAPSPPDNGFGRSVAISGDWIAVKSLRTTDDPPVQGPVHLFERSGGTWLLRQSLLLPGGAENDLLGHSLALDGDLLAIGAPRDPEAGYLAGAVHLFRRTGAQWSFVDKLLADDAGPRQMFGAAVVLQGSRLVVGAPMTAADVPPPNLYGGAVYVFDDQGGSFSQTWRLTAPDPAPQRYFGRTLAVDGDTLVASEYIHGIAGPASGLVHAFDRQADGAWTHSGAIAPADHAAQHYFGVALALQGDELFVGSHQPRVYVFRRSPTGWSEQSPITTDDLEPDALFGRELAVDGDELIIGGRSGGATNAERMGMAFLFDRDNGGWAQREVLTGESSIFAWRVDLDDGRVVVGSYGSPLSNQGAAYVYEVQACAWAPLGTLPVAADASFHFFGKTVDVDGDLGVVGSSGPDVVFGEVHVFRRLALGWQREGHIAQDLPPTGGSPGYLGSSVAIDGETILAARQGSGSDLGGAVVIERSPSGWQLEQKLISPTNQRIGPIALRGNWAVVAGAPFPGSGAGNVDLFVRDASGNWTFRQTLPHPTTMNHPTDEFGGSITLGVGWLAVHYAHRTGPHQERNAVALYRLTGSQWVAAGDLPFPEQPHYSSSAFSWGLSMDGSRLAVGVPSVSDFGLFSGATYLFRLSNDSWNQEVRLVSPYAAAIDRAGEAVALAGNRLVVAAPGAEQMTGRIDVFEHVPGAGWEHRGRLAGSANSVNPQWGSVVGLDGDALLVGSPSDTGLGPSSGAVDVFDFSPGSAVLEATLRPFATRAYDRFGSATAADGSTAVVSAPGDDDPGPNAGSVQVYVRSGGDWAPQARLTPPDTGVGLLFGFAVAINGDRIVVGSPLDHTVAPYTGAAYVFERSNGLWSLAQTLITGVVQPNDRYGTAVAVHGDVIVVGNDYKPTAGSYTGAAYLFRRGSGGWVETSALEAPTPAQGDRFGNSVAVDAGRLVVGALGHQGGRGAVFVYTPGNGDTWDLERVLTGASPGSRLGAAVALEGDTLMVGAVGDGPTTDYAGTVYVYDLASAGSVPVDQLQPGDPGPGMGFGGALALRGSRVVAGAHWTLLGNEYVGAAYVFHRDGSGWQREGVLMAPAPAEYDFFGYAVAIGDGFIVAGAPYADVGAQSTGLTATFACEPNS